MEKKSRLFLLDAMALIYRAHFAFIKNPRINTKGMDTGAVLGFTNALVDILKREQPTHVVVALDTAAPTLRHQKFPAYKAHRQAQPEAITIALGYVKRIVEAFGIPLVERLGYEADDLIGTLAYQAAQADFEVCMVTPDKDFGQLVQERVMLYKPGMSGRQPEIWRAEAVRQHWSVDDVIQITDVLGLWGDASDNIPGVPHVGEKTAKKLIKQFGTLENVLQNAHQLPKKLGDSLRLYSEQALLSKQLATIYTDVPLCFDLEHSRYTEPDVEQLGLLFEELEFRVLKQRILGRSDVLSATSAQTNLFSDNTVFETVKTPVQLKEPVVGSNNTLHSTPHQYRCMDTHELRQQLLEQLLNEEYCCFSTVVTGPNLHQASLLGLAFCYKPREAYYVSMPEDLEAARKALALFQAFFNHAGIKKVGHTLKYDLITLQRYAIDVRNPLCDVLLMHHLLFPEGQHVLKALAENYLRYTPMDVKQATGKADSRPWPKNTLIDHACEKVDIILQLSQKLAPQIDAQGLSSLAYQVEMPLIPVLAHMEAVGVAIDPGVLQLLGEEVQQDLERLEKDIHNLAGTAFSVTSSKQLGQVLFEKLQLAKQPPRTKSGQYATSDPILSTLVNKHPIIAKIRAHRELKKLKSTYIDAFPLLICPNDSRVHASYNQAVVITGRLSTTRPNLQNIPIRTTKGQDVRKAVVPADVRLYRLVAADYSQIELRIVADFSKDAAMIAAFLADQDIHAATAAKIFGKDLEMVTPDMRRQAKTINFSILYGISAFGLAQRLGITRTEASAMIKSYFREFSGVRAYMERTIQHAREQGFVTTLMGRRRYLRDINSRNASLRGFSERNAINMPIQGTAAELIKLAMIRIHEWIQSECPRSKMIMQVHDELVFEVHKEDLERIQIHVPRLMQTALKLSVPLKVDVGIGKNWLAAR